MKHLFALACFVATIHVFGQVAHGGQPWQWENKHPNFQIPVIRTDAIDLAALSAEDAIVDQYKDQPYRFGVDFQVNYDLFEHGISTYDAVTGLRIVQLGIECAGALAISIRFDEYRVPKGGYVYVWSEDRKEFLGGFNHLNNKTSAVLALGLVHGDKIVVEYTYPDHLTDHGQLRIGEIVHCYRPFATSPFVQEALAQRGPFGSGGACEVNVNCPEGADWQVEKRAVAIITQSGSGLCTGSLVNNTANDGTPYFLTANHCITWANTDNWVFYFNHEAANCGGSNGPTTDLISGAEVLANNADSDFALLLLNETPPPSYNVQYAGWDATDSEVAVESAVCIHHPAGDVKKISFENDAPYHDVAAGAEVWWVDDWELAVTEGGSSGSPLYDQNHRVIGQLYGGLSACNGSSGNGQYDYFGRFGVSWDNGNSAATRLRDWLDPGNSGVLVLDGYPDGFEALNNDAVAGAIMNIAPNNCSAQVSPAFTLLNQGTETMTSCTINYQLNNGPVVSINWSGALGQNQSEIVDLPDLIVADGANTLTVWITAPNGVADQDNNDNTTEIAFNAITSSATTINVEITFDGYAEETSWALLNNNNVVASGNDYGTQTSGSSVNIELCVASGCYDFEIYDSYGDGMCCNYGDGGYVVTNNQGDILASGAEFGDVESTQICTTVGTDDSDDFQLSLYPNPANDIVRVQCDSFIQEIVLMDILGRPVSTTRINSYNAEISVSSLSDGVYMITLITDSGVQSAKLTVRHG